jgi:hypothetical protein
MSVILRSVRLTARACMARARAAPLASRAASLAAKAQASSAPSPGWAYAGQGYRGQGAASASASASRGLYAKLLLAAGAAGLAYNTQQADSCGIIGVVGGGDDASKYLLEGLTIMRNRGYDSAGMATIDAKKGYAGALY